MTPRCKHEFTALYAHFGEHGRQDVHYHVCLNESCDRALIGKTRECDGNPKSHKREWLSVVVRPRFQAADALSGGSD